MLNFNVVYTAATSDLNARRLAAVLAAALLLAAALAGGLRPWGGGSADAGTLFTAGESGVNHLCDEDDLVETGLQGDVPWADQQNGRALQGYNCGLDLIGHSDLGGRGGNANMAWAGHCAYVTTGDPFGDGGEGIAVVDVSDPTDPLHVGTLTGPGSTDTLETIHAVETPDRSVLVAGRYALTPFEGPTPMDIYDVSDCASPRLVTTFLWPESIHNLTVTADGNRVFSTLGLQALDISGDWDAPGWEPRYLGNIETKLRDQYGDFVGSLPERLSSPRPLLGDRYRSHEAWPNHDGTKLYVGGQLEAFETFSIIDLTDIDAPRMISETSGRGHSVRTATIDGVPYVLHSEESIIDPIGRGCVPEEANPTGGAAQPWLTNISDETAPRLVSQFTLEINDPLNCPQQILSGVNASAHYHDVDDPADTSFAMVSMWNAGLRVVDVRDPYRPTEVAYFNPAMFETANGRPVLERTWGHVRWLPESGQIWLSSQIGGFWVLSMQDQVRTHLELERSPGDPTIGPLDPVLDILGTKGIVRAPVVDTSGWYCTLSPVNALTSSPLDASVGVVADRSSSAVDLARRTKNLL